MSEEPFSRGPGRAARAVSRGVTAVLGSWSPPPWLRWGGRQLRRRPVVTVAALALAAAGWFGWREWSAWREAHRPRSFVQEVVEIRQLKPVVQPPAPPSVTAEGVIGRSPLVLVFDGNAAPVEAVEKAASGFTLRPGVEGEWKWRDARTAVFDPQQPWPAGSDYTARIDPAQLAPHTRLAQLELPFTTPPVEVRLEQAIFQTDQKDPAVHQAVAEFRVTHPVDRAAFIAQLEFRVLGTSPVFRKNGQPTADVPSVDVVTDETDPTRHFWVRSAAILPPEQEDFARFKLRAGLVSLVGGKGTTGDATGTVRLPTRDSGFGITRARAITVPREDGEPQQMIFVETRGFAAPSTIARALEAWVLPVNTDTEGNDIGWQGASEVTPTVLERSRRVALTAVPAEAPVVAMHAFEFRVSEPGTLFLRVPAGLEALGGFRLALPFGMITPVPAIPRELRLVGEGGVLALNGEKKLSVKSRGVEKLRFTLARVPAASINHLVSQTRGEFSTPAFRGAFREDNIAHLSRTEQPVAMRSPFEACWSTYDFSAAFQAPDGPQADAARGLFFLDVDEPPLPAAERADGQSEDDSALHDRRFVLVTDLGLIVKRNADDSREVFVQSIQEGGPVADVRITALAVNGDPLAELVTDPEGHASLLPLSHLKREKRPVALVARKGNDVAFLPWDRSDRKLEFSDFDTGGIISSAGDALTAFVFSERGIYRPGETLHAAAIVRRRDWQPLPETLPLIVELRDAEEQLVEARQLAATADGAVDTTFELAATRRTGVYTLRVLLPETEKKQERQPIGRLRVRVEDFQPDRMKLAAVLSRSAPGWIEPKDVMANLTLETLFGTAAEGRRVSGRLRLTPVGSGFAAFPGYDFRLWTGRDLDPAQREVSLGELTTDGAGKAAFDLQLERFAAASFEAEVELEAFEPDGGRSVRTAVATRVSPLPYAVGWKAEGRLDWIAKDLPMALRLVAVGPDMRAVAVDGLRRRVLETKHVSVLSKRPDGGYAYVSTEKEEEVEAAPFAIAAGGTDVPLLTSRPGRFHLEVSNAAGQTVSQVAWHVVGAGESSHSLEKNAELELSLATTTWQPGGLVDFNVRAPFTGAGLVTVERDRVLAWKWFRGGSTSFTSQIGVPEALEGSGYVNVAFVRGLDSPEVFTSPLSYGVAPIHVEPVRRRLPLEIDAPSLVKPGEMLRVGFRTARPARVVLWAVDEGIHRVTNYTLPQPVEHFFRKCALEVETSQLVDQIIPEYTQLGRAKAFGGDGDGEDLLKLGLNPFQRKREASVVWWSGFLEAGPERREATYQLPDFFSGGLTIMGMVVAPDALGVAETHAVARGAFVLTANVPTFVAPGDEFTASLTVANTLEPPAPVTVTPSAALGGSLELQGEAPAPFDLGPGKETTVRFRVRAGREPGPAELTFSVAAGAETTSRKATLSVRPAVPFMTHVRSGYFRQDTFDLPVERSLLDAFAQREVSASALPVSLTKGLASYLETYPYGCSEQITSQSMSRLLALDPSSPPALRAEARRQIEHTLAVLRSRQAPHGGFGYWDGRASADGVDWLSVYVAHFLTEAKRAGVDPPEEMAKALRARLQKMAGEAVTSRTAAAVQAQAIYLLTSAGDVTTNHVLNLRDQLQGRFKDAWHADLTAAWLAGTYALLQQKDEAEGLMKAHRTALEKWRLRPRSWEAYYENTLGYEAQSILVTCAHFPKLASGLGYDQLKPVLDPLQRGSFNTVGSAWAILALKAYSRLEADSGVQAGLAMLSEPNAAPTMLAPPRAGLMTTAFPAAARTLRVQRFRADGGPDLGLFYQVVEAGFDVAMPDRAVSDGLEVHQELDVPPTGLSVGDGAKMTVRIRNVTNRALTHLACLNLLPGGFEIEHESLKPGPDSVPGAEYVDVREDRNAFFFSLARDGSVVFTFRVKPTCAGRFTVPPGFAESMYLRELKARGVAGVVEVKGRE